MLPGRTRRRNLLFPRLSRYVLLQLEFKSDAVCLLTTCSCKVSQVLDCKLSNAHPYVCGCVQYSASDTKPSCPAATSMKGSLQ